MQERRNGINTAVDHDENMVNHIFRNAVPRSRERCKSANDESPGEFPYNTQLDWTQFTTLLRMESFGDQHRLVF